MIGVPDITLCGDYEVLMGLAQLPISRWGRLPLPGWLWPYLPVAEDPTSSVGEVVFRHRGQQIEGLTQVLRLLAQDDFISPSQDLDLVDIDRDL